jgi:HTH-type transcriptional repressor of NAD biosynthesis genes
MKGKDTMKRSCGMVLGKFMPPHLGHLYLCDFARNYVDELTIVVGTLPSEPIPGVVRFEWMRQLYPDCNVVHLDKVLPQDPSETSDFWDLWRTALRDVVSQLPDVVFASEAYGHRLAKELGARFIPVDPDRSIHHVSGTAVRQDPFQHWDMLPACVRPWYAKRVCVFGPESTGKSTLTMNLARHFDTVAIPEYARTYLEAQDGKLSFADIPQIARGQMASEDALIPQSNRIAIQDTDLLETVVWSKFLYGECPEWIEQEAGLRRADLYILTDVDVPWVADVVRYLPEDRMSFFENCKAALESMGANYIVVSGDWNTRFHAAVNAVEASIAIK